MHLPIIVMVTTLAVDPPAAPPPGPALQELKERLRATVSGEMDGLVRRQVSEEQSLDRSALASRKVSVDGALLPLLLEREWRDRGPTAGWVLRVMAEEYRPQEFRLSAPHPQVRAEVEAAVDRMVSALGAGPTHVRTERFGAPGGDWPALIEWSLDGQGAATAEWFEPFLGARRLDFPLTPEDLQVVIRADGAVVRAGAGPGPGVGAGLGPGVGAERAVAFDGRPPLLCNPEDLYDLMDTLRIAGRTPSPVVVAESAEEPARERTWTLLGSGGRVLQRVEWELSGDPPLVRRIRVQQPAGSLLYQAPHTIRGEARVDGELVDVQQARPEAEVPFLPGGMVAELLADGGLPRTLTVSADGVLLVRAEWRGAGLENARSARQSLRRELEAALASAVEADHSEVVARLAARLAADGVPDEWVARNLLAWLDEAAGPLGEAQKAREWCAPQWLAALAVTPVEWRLCECARLVSAGRWVPALLLADQLIADPGTPAGARRWLERLPPLLRKWALPGGTRPLDEGPHAAWDAQVDAALWPLAEALVPARGTAGGTGGGPEGANDPDGQSVPGAAEPESPLAGALSAAVLRTEALPAADRISLAREVRRQVARAARSGAGAAAEASMEAGLIRTLAADLEAALRARRLPALPELAGLDEGRRWLAEWIAAAAERALRRPPPDPMERASLRRLLDRAVRAALAYQGPDEAAQLAADSLERQAPLLGNAFVPEWEWPPARVEEVGEAHFLERLRADQILAGSAQLPARARADALAFSVMTELTALLMAGAPAPGTPEGVDRELLSRGAALVEAAHAGAVNRAAPVRRVELDPHTLEVVREIPEAGTRAPGRSTVTLQDAAAEALSGSGLRQVHHAWVLPDWWRVPGP